MNTGYTSNIGQMDIINQKPIKKNQLAELVEENLILRVQVMLSVSGSKNFTKFQINSSTLKSYPTIWGQSSEFYT